MILTESCCRGHCTANENKHRAENRCNRKKKVSEMLYRVYVLRSRSEIGYTFWDQSEIGYRKSDILV